MKTIHVIILGLVIISCNPCRKIAKHPECFPTDTIKLTEKQIITDSIIVIEPDESIIDLFLQCDSSYNVLISELSEEKNKHGTITTKIVYRDNKLQIKSFTDSISILHRIIENYKDQKISVINPVNEQLKRNNKKLSAKLQKRKWLIYYFIISILFVVAWVSFFIVKR